MPSPPTVRLRLGSTGALAGSTRPRTTTIDIHSHVSVPAAAAVVAPISTLSTIPLAFFSTPETKQVNAQQECTPCQSRITGATRGSPNVYVISTTMGIDIQVVMPPPPQCYYTVPLDIAVKATQYRQ